MAVLVEFAIPDATEEQMWAVEERTRARGEAAGGPPYTGLMFLAATPSPSGLRIVSAWRTEADFRTVLDTMLGPDLADVGLTAADVVVSPVASMAIPGTHGP
jgi:uncharacterized protein YjiS (DUF1127 family)